MKFWNGWWLPYHHIQYTHITDYTHTQKTRYPMCRENDKQNILWWKFFQQTFFQGFFTIHTIFLPCIVSTLGFALVYTKFLVLKYGWNDKEKENITDQQITYPQINSMTLALSNTYNFCDLNNYSSLHFWFLDFCCCFVSNSYWMCMGVKFMDVLLSDFWI